MVVMVSYWVNDYLTPQVSYSLHYFVAFSYFRDACVTPWFSVFLVHHYRSSSPTLSVTLKTAFPTILVTHYDC